VNKQAKDLQDDSPSPVKDILYRALDRFSLEKQTASKLSEFTATITEYCLPEIIKLKGSQDENLGSFAEGLLHYLLTNALIPSQRKVTVRGVEIDIAIPDARIFSTRPKDGLVVFFVKTRDGLDERLAKMRTIQPHDENIWVVAKESMNLPHTTYEILGKGSFVHIVDDISKFASSRPQSKLRIFKIGK
jgi:hypothetical protein